MATVNVVYQMYRELSPAERKVFARLVYGRKVLDSVDIPGAGDIDSFLAELRFGGKRPCCVHCGSESVKRNGHKDGKQRYLCKDCGKTFGASTGTVFRSAKKPLSTYLQYVHCMMRGMFVRETAGSCGMGVANAFYMRHKILDALQSMQDSVTLDGVAQADGTFFAISFKGNHSRSVRFTLPRMPHHRGTPASKRGLSSEKVCVECAVNGSGLSIASITNLGKASCADISRLLDGRISEGSVLCTDKNSAYVDFADRNGLELVQIDSGKHVKGAFNIQRVNSYHSRLKKFIGHFTGVATKYLNNYLVWFNLTHIAEGDDDFLEKVWQRHNARARYSGTKRSYMLRSAIPVAA